MYTDETSTEFLIVVFDVPERQSDLEFDAQADAEMLKVNGADKQWLKRGPVTFNGFHGRQYVYKRGKLSGVAVIINAGHRIYFLHFHTENVKGIARGPVNRVFTTFQPTP